MDDPIRVAAGFIPLVEKEVKDFGFLSRECFCAAWTAYGDFLDDGCSIQVGSFPLYNAEADVVSGGKEIPFFQVDVGPDKGLWEKCALVFFFFFFLVQEKRAFLAAGRLFKTYLKPI